MATRTFTAAFSTKAVDAYSVAAFREEHRLGRPSEASVTCQLVEYVDPEAMIGTTAELAFTVGDDGTPHRFAGIVEAVTIIGTTEVGGQSVHHVRFHVVSTMALLGRSVGSQIFQEMDVKDIVSK